MADKENPSLEIPLRAAKGVSQFFLFEALRNGCDEIDHASSQFGSARDKAEKMLAKDSPVEFEALIQDILESCAKSLQAHAAIVEAVAETLRSNADDHDGSGKHKINKFALLVAQIKDAAAGVEELRDVKVDKEESPPLPTESDFDSEPEVLSSKKSKARKPEEAILSKKKKTKSKHASNTSAPITETASPEVLDDKTMKGKGKKLSKPSKTSASNTPEEAEQSVKTKAAKVKHLPQSSEPAPGAKLDTPMADEDFSPATPKPVPAQQSFVDDDEINAEVDARLAAKEAKRAKKKEAKKRKRDSVASDIFSPDPKAEPAHITPLPAKKKARIDRVDDSGVKEKRQSVDDTPSSKLKTKKQKIDDAAEREEKNVEVNKANKAKRRRSSNSAVPEAPVAAPQTNRNKKRKLGF